MKIYRLISLLFLFTLSALASPDDNAKSLGLVFKPKPQPSATFVYAVRSGNLLFISGHISVTPQGKIIKGKLGKDLTTAQGNEAAKMAGIEVLATIVEQLGSLNAVERIVKVTGMVNASPEFTEHSQVINGFSDLMVEVFGDKGQHARAAVGMSSLPANAAVEVEMILEIKPQ